MRVQVIFDKQALGVNIQTGWGISFLIDDKILFDTGEKGPWLLKNMNQLGLDIKGIEAVVISHDHWDHWGGLWDILQMRRGMKVYICPHVSKEFKEKAQTLQAQLIEAEKFVEISQNIFITGEMSGAYHDAYIAEQAVVLKTENGLTILTGCAHPGILKMVEKVKNKFPVEPIYFVAGGFHLMESDKRAIGLIAENFKTMGVMKVAPMHCAGNEAEEVFKKYYKENFVSVKAGQEITV